MKIEADTKDFSSILDAILTKTESASLFRFSAEVL